MGHISRAATARSVATECAIGRKEKAVQPATKTATLLVQEPAALHVFLEESTVETMKCVYHPWKITLESVSELFLPVTR